jgi:hypothetical protein
MTTADHHMLQISFPISQPEGTALAHVEPGTGIEGVPTWSIQTLNAGPLRSSPAYDRHLRDTVGSSYDWSDEFRFDKRSGRLTSFVLKTPELGQVDPEVAGGWLALPRQTGIPVLEDRENGFHIDPLDLRFLANDGSALVVTDASLPRADGDSLRLAIDTDVDLLFHRGRYRGWILNNPVAHLVAEPGDRIPGSDDPRLHDLLREYLTLVVQPNIDRMSDEDPAMREALEALASRIQAVNAVQARALESAVERVLEVFYPG